MNNTKEHIFLRRVIHILYKSFPNARHNHTTMERTGLRVPFHVFSCADRLRTSNPAGCVFQPSYVLMVVFFLLFSGGTGIMTARFDFRKPLRSKRDILNACYADVLQIWSAPEEVEIIDG